MSIWRALAILLLAGCSPSEPAEPSAPLGVLLVTVDTLRADHLSSYGYERPTSPHIDALAARGLRFDNAIAQRGGTWPSLSSILTSRYPRSHGVRANGEMLGIGKVTIAQLLQKRGFATAAFITNMLTAPNRGFDERLYVKEGQFWRRDRMVVEKSLDWMEEQRGSPFFAWIHMLGPHHPYEPSESFARKYANGYSGTLDGSDASLKQIHRERKDLSSEELAHIVSLYDGAIEEMDVRVGELMSGLEARDLLDSTLVVLTSDHGEELYDHNRYFLHSLSIYESVLRVPLVFSLPGLVPEGAVSDAVVQSIDVAPSIFDLLGLEIPPFFEGRSLRPELLEPGAPSGGPGEAFSELGAHIYSLRTPDWRYIYNPRRYTSPARSQGDRGRLGHFQVALEELYDLRADPGEQRNLAGERREVTAKLRRRLRAWMQQGPRERRARAPSQEAQQELRALGYIQ